MQSRELSAPDHDPVSWVGWSLALPHRPERVKAQTWAEARDRVAVALGGVSHDRVVVRKAGEEDVS